MCVTDKDTMMENNEGNAGSLFGGLGGLGAPRQSNLQVKLLDLSTQSCSYPNGFFVGQLVNNHKEKG